MVRSGIGSKLEGGIRELSRALPSPTGSSSSSLSLSLSRDLGPCCRGRLVA
ncbi:hypothetical protein Syun_013818 [Stephania yunnanensis]|uniref:Uncharacterized protein n=1 Tax=Stephania yunnanensis TaxID=152371 RepID=A0AAP0JI23_9MAGN